MIQHKQLQLDHSINNGVVTINPNGTGPTVKIESVALRRACRAWLMQQEGYVMDEKNMVVASESNNGRTFYMLDLDQAITVPVHKAITPAGECWRPTGGVDKSYFVSEMGEGGTLSQSKHSICLLLHFMDARIEVPLTDKNQAILDYEVIYCAATQEKRTKMEQERKEAFQRSQTTILFARLAAGAHTLPERIYAR